jgi:hypothetical protein
MSSDKIIIDFKKTTSTKKIKYVRLTKISGVKQKSRRIENLKLEYMDKKIEL